ncbi:hypothetical protein H6G06_10110 [Anabaena sphaerica FACHB-251]|uniref:Uncharacterized protein n=1 Tax=Anabaena sphaerica FACHB-251 TaxID=2692883 RepID=A0A926WG39_9NOST|nr:hypothetical protein [Anabaena sphaerica]MBD2293838.1 hypothetical protein [Anabaena sphaerica FACHB-251]
MKGEKHDVSAAYTYLNKAENFYEQIDFKEKKLANILANKARIDEYLQNWNNAIDAFSELLETGKNLKSMNTIADAGVHLVRIHIKKSASLVEWLQLIKKLGFYGIMALLKVLFQQKQRLF